MSSAFGFSFFFFFLHPPSTPTPSLPVVEVVKLLVSLKHAANVVQRGKEAPASKRRWRKCSREKLQLQWLALKLVREVGLLRKYAQVILIILCVCVCVV